MDKFKEKYIKYKLKYLNLKKIKGGVYEDCNKHLLLNFAIYNDINSLNDRKIFTTRIEKDKIYNIDVTTLTKNEVIYRGYNNLKILNLLTPPGSEIDKFRNEPTWFASPEIALIYTCRNNISNLKKSYIGYKSYIDFNDNDFQNILRQYKHILECNHSAICSYTLHNDVDLVDINNTDNLKQILDLFDNNFTEENYNKLNVLERISLRKKTRLFYYLNLKINNDKTLTEEIKTEKNTINLDIDDNTLEFIDLKTKFPSLNVNINDIINLVESDILKSKLFDLYFLKNFDILQDIIKNTFRKVFAFGNYWDVDKRREKITRRETNNDKKVCLSKFVDKISTTQINSDIQIHRNDTKDNIWQLEKFREYLDSIMPKITKKIKDDGDLLNTIYEEISYLIEEYKKKEIEDIEKKTESFKRRNLECQLDNLVEIGRIEKLVASGNKNYKIIKIKGGKIGIDSSDENISKIYYNLEKLSEDGKDFYSNNEECKFCKLAKTTNWLKEVTAENHPSHLLGLVKNFTYYEYDTIKKKPIPFAIIFENIYGKSVDSVTEARYLTIPYAHLPTMGDHKDCENNKVSKRFPPLGGYHPTRNHPNCGANLYSKIDEEQDNPATLRYFLSLLECAKTFGFKEYNRPHELAECDYEHYNGNFYKYLAPTKKNLDSLNNGKLYLAFHTRANSEPHIHMHTFIDSRSSNLYDTLETSRNINKNINSIGKNVADEIFGSSIYGLYKYNEEDKNNITKTGKRKLPKSLEDYIKPDPWVTRTVENGEYIKSDKVNRNYKYMFAGSFEIMIKRILGLDNDPVESKKKWLIHTCDYSDLQPEIYDQNTLYVEHIRKYNSESKRIFDINSNINNILNDYNNQYKYFDNIFSEKDYNTDDYKYTLTSNISAYNRVNHIYENNEDLINNIINNIDPNTKIYTNKYGMMDDESCMTRQSVTEDDAIMILCMEFAFINNPKIGGYFGSSAPLMNKFKNITHPELCLFNLVDYPIKININSDFASCFNTGDSMLFRNRNNLDLLVLYEVYFRNCQKTYNYTKTKKTKIDIINTFMESQYEDRLNNPINYEGNIDVYEESDEESDEEDDEDEIQNISGGLKQTVITNKKDTNIGNLKINGNDFVYRDLKIGVDKSISKDSKIDMNNSVYTDLKIGVNNNLSKDLNKLLNNIIGNFSGFTNTILDSKYISKLSNIVSELDYNDDIQKYSIVRIIEYFIIKYKKPNIELSYLDASKIKTVINLSQYIDVDLVKFVNIIIDLLIEDLNNNEFVERFRSDPNKFVNIEHIMNIIFADVLLTPDKVINSYNTMIKDIDAKLEIDNSIESRKLLDLTFSYLYHGMIPSDSIGYQYYNT